MKRFGGCVLIILIWGGVSLAQSGTAMKPDPMPPTAPPTAASLYRLIFELEQGRSYRDFIRTVPNSFVIKEPRDVVAACRRLGLEAKHRKANWSDLLQLKVPFLAQTNQHQWLLYRVKEGAVHRLEPGKEDAAPVTEGELLRIWTHDIITVTKPQPVVSAEGGARIRFAETKHDFGEVWQGEKVEHLFVFENVGSGTLEITNVRASCGCTAALVGRTVAEAVTSVRRSNPDEERAFAPGESGHIKVTLNTAGKRNRAHSSVTVTTNDPTQPSIRLEVNAEVKVAVEVMPSVVSFGLVNKNSNLTREVRITAASDPNFQILDATSSNPRVFLTCEKIEPVNENRPPGYRLKVSLDIEGMEYGERIQDMIVVRTTSERLPRLDIRVTATVSGEILVSSPRLYFGLLPPNREVTRFLTLTNTGKHDLEILEIRNPIPNLSLERETPPKGNKQYRIKAILKSGDEPQPVNGEIVIVTNHPEQNEIHVAVTASVRQNLQPK